MAAYPLDSWKTLFPLLDSWQGLIPAQRHEALALPARYLHPVHAFAELDPAQDAILFETDELGKKRPSPGCKRLQSFIERLCAWSAPDGIDIGRFVDLYTIYAQRYALTGARNASQAAVTAAYDKSLRDGGFTRKLLESKSLLNFLDSLGGWVPDGIDFTEARYKALKTWVKVAIAEPPAIFVLRPGSFPSPSADVAPEEILYLALAYGAALVGCMPDTLDPFILVLEPREIKVQDPGKLALPRFAPKETWSRPFLLDDMEAYLRALKADPAPLLSDGASVPITHHRKVARGFGPLPFAPGPAGFNEESRARTAWWMLLELKLIETTGRGRKSRRAHPAPRAALWIAARRESRLEDLLAKSPCGARKRFPVHARFDFLGDFAANPFPYPALTGRLFEWMDAFFSRLEKPAPWSLAVAAAAERANPFLADMESDANLPGVWARWEAAPQETYAALLHQYAGRLASLGALALHRDAQGNLGVSLTEVGRWIYGRLDRWTLPMSARRVAVVGGDFTVTLLEPAPDFLLELRNFAEPSAPGGNGSAWRLTRRSVQEAAHNGLAAEGILETLRVWTKHALPANVVHEIEGWAGARRGVRLSEAVLVEGEDALSVAEILSAFPKDFERVSPTLLKAKAGAKRGALVRKLAKKGFFTE